MNNNQDDESEVAKPYLNVPLPTLGGKQFWTDYAWRRGWRLQKNAMTGLWRVLDDRNIRQAWGPQAACEDVLQKQVPVASLKHPRVFILLHGLIRSASSMASLEKVLEKEFDCEVLCFEYASTRDSISKHAEAFRAYVASLPPNTKIALVGHSMGNIVARHAIGDWQRAKDSHTLERIDRFVMLGPPNQGASIARQLSKIGLFEWITGEGGMELGPKWEEFEGRLATPHCEFGIIAGRLENQPIQNPLVDGEGDFVVSVEEAKLEGSNDFLELPRLHSFLMDDAEVQRAVIHFMKTGRFTKSSAESGQ
ncbi:MAG: esterase/lipase family protein [Aureliella sp.]